MREQDSVIVSGLRVYSRIGCSAAERKVPQEVIINLDLTLTVQIGVVCIDLSDTVCFRTLAEAAKELAEKQEWNLVEDLALALVSLCFEAQARVSNVIVEVRKRSVPECNWVGVRLCRAYSRG